MTSPSSVMRNAWANYRSAAKASGTWNWERGTFASFKREIFAFYLRLAWAEAKGVYTQPAQPARAIEINDEIHALALSDRMDWTRNDELRAELARIAAQPNPREKRP